MHAQSTLARLQQGIVTVTLAVALSWLCWMWPTSPVLGVVGALLVWFSYAGILGLQLLLMRAIGDTDPRVPKPTPLQLMRAWWGELIFGQKVFFWRQPFRWAACPDAISDVKGRRGVILVHGFVCNRGFWNPWMHMFREARVPYLAVNLEPVFGAIDEYAAAIDAAVARMRDATGRPPVIVGHSMGGLAVRAWLRVRRDASAAHHVITIGSPHHGTWLARFSHTLNGRQMRLMSAWVIDLAQDESTRQFPPWTCWYSNCDNIVFPASSAALPHADNRLVLGPAHVELAFEPQIMRSALEIALG